MRKGLLIGLGTGRCGTTSLAHLLNSVEGCSVSHETPAARLALAWKFSQKGIISALDSLRMRNAKVVGDVAFFYLPYVEWIAKENPDATFVCMKRGREETVNSYMNKTKKRDHWSSQCRGQDPWDKMYPKFDTQDKREAIGMYWDMYYKEASRLEASGVKIKTFDMGLLNTVEGVKEILDFCGLGDETARVGVRKNRL